MPTLGSKNDKRSIHTVLEKEGKAKCVEEGCHQDNRNKRLTTRVRRNYETVRQILSVVPILTFYVIVVFQQATQIKKRLFLQ